MHGVVNAVTGRLSLRSPQRRSLEIPDRVTEPASLRKGADAFAIAAIEVPKTESPTLTDLERHALDLVQ